MRNLDGGNASTCTGTMSDMAGCTWAWGLEAWEEAEAQIELSQTHLIELRSYLNARSQKNFWKNLGLGATLGAKATKWAMLLCSSGFFGSLKNFSGKNFRKTEGSLRQPLAMMVFA